jgi:hypothetical protein
MTGAAVSGMFLTSEGDPSLRDEINFMTKFIGAA